MLNFVTRKALQPSKTATDLSIHNTEGNLKTQTEVGRPKIAQKKDLKYDFQQVENNVRRGSSVG